MKIYDKLEQGTPEWLEVRLGKLTASRAQAVGANGKGLETLVYEKVAEIMTGKPKEHYTNPDMERGNALELLARNSYELETGNIVKQVGFVELNKHVGCSPDGLIGKDGLVEIKCKNDANFVKHLYEKSVDSEYAWQMNFQMLVTGRKWVDYVVFNPNFKKSTSIIKVAKDETLIKKLEMGIERGCKMIKGILAEVK